jgi:hypothetical protein
MIHASITDKQLNNIVDRLLGVPQEERLASDGQWGERLEVAMAVWEDRHPGTRPPAYTKIGPPPPCLSGTVPPIYDGDLE